MIFVIRQPATAEQVEQMKEFGGNFIKLAVDVNREILTGGGELHSDCEEALLEDGSQQVDVWGADWVFTKKEVTFESIINIRPSQNNMSSVIQDTTLKNQIEIIVRRLFGDE
ncbi:DUF5674 family protein [Anaerolineales bacterium HSG6]|nr:DUF5674 family protein [Anaerolineales bacterium HSG6]